MDLWFRLENDVKLIYQPVVPEVHVHLQEGTLLRGSDVYANLKRRSHSSSTCSLVGIHVTSTAKLGHGHL